MGRRGFLSFFVPFLGIWISGLGSLRPMGGGGMLRPLQVRDGPGHPEDPVVAAGGEAHALEGPPQELFPRLVQGAVSAHQGRGKLGVAERAVLSIAPALPPPGLVHPLLHRRGGLRALPAAQGVKVH